MIGAYAWRPACGPDWPKPEIDSMIRRGLTADSRCQPHPSRSATPGRKFSMRMSHARTRSRNVGSAGSRKSRLTDRLPQLSCAYSPELPSTILPNAWEMSEPGRSIFTTSAPRSEGIRPESGPERARDRSSTRTPSSGRFVTFAISVRPGQSEDVLGKVVEDHLLRHRGDAHQPGLTPVPLDVVLGGVAESAVGLQRRVRGGEASLGGQVLGCIRLLPAGQALVDP